MVDLSLAISVNLVVVVSIVCNSVTFMACCLPLEGIEDGDIGRTLSPQPLLLLDVLTMTSTFVLYTLPAYLSLSPAGELELWSTLRPVQRTLHAAAAWWALLGALGAKTTWRACVTVAMACVVTECARYAGDQRWEALVAYTVPCTLASLCLACPRDEGITGGARAVVTSIQLSQVSLAVPAAIVAVVALVVRSRRVADAEEAIYYCALVVNAASATRWLQLVSNRPFRRRLRALMTGQDFLDVTNNRGAEGRMSRDITTTTLISHTGNI